MADKKEERKKDKMDIFCSGITQLCERLEG